MQADTGALQMNRKKLFIVLLSLTLVAGCIDFLDNPIISNLINGQSGQQGSQQSNGPTTLGEVTGNLFDPVGQPRPDVGFFNAKVVNNSSHAASVTFKFLIDDVVVHYTDLRNVAAGYTAEIAGPEQAGILVVNGTSETGRILPETTYVFGTDVDDENPAVYEITDPQPATTPEPTTAPISTPTPSSNPTPAPTTGPYPTPTPLPNDCNNNGIDDMVEVSSGSACDCNGNYIPDVCEPDCNNNYMADECDISSGESFDCNVNGIPDECESDCNQNGVADECDIAEGTSTDCQPDGIPDECQTGVATTTLLFEDFEKPSFPPLNWYTYSLNTNGSWELNTDSYDAHNGLQSAWHRWVTGETNDYLITSELTSADTLTLWSKRGYGAGWSGDYQVDIVLVVGDVGGTDDIPVYNLSEDWDYMNYWVETVIDLKPHLPAGPFRVAIRCHGYDSDDIYIDDLRIISTSVLGNDCNENGMPDACDPDCNGNNIPDECDIEEGTSYDCDYDLIPDECEVDCNSNGYPDDCELIAGSAQDCQGNQVPDECDIANGTSLDINGNNIPDECEGTTTTSLTISDNTGDPHSITIPAFVGTEFEVKMTLRIPDTQKISKCSFWLQDYTEDPNPSYPFYIKGRQLIHSSLIYPNEPVGNYCNNDSTHRACDLNPVIGDSDTGMVKLDLGSNSTGAVDGTTEVHSIITIASDGNTRPNQQYRIIISASDPGTGKTISPPCWTDGNGRVQPFDELTDSQNPYVINVVYNAP